MEPHESGPTPGEEGASGDEKDERQVDDQHGTGEHFEHIPASDSTRGPAGIGSR